MPTSAPPWCSLWWARGRVVGPWWKGSEWAGGQWRGCVVTDTAPALRRAPAAHHSGSCRPGTSLQHGHRHSSQWPNRKSTTIKTRLCTLNFCVTSLAHLSILRMMNRTKIFRSLVLNVVEWNHKQDYNSKPNQIIMCASVRAVIMCYNRSRTFLVVLQGEGDLWLERLHRLRVLQTMDFYTQTQWNTVNTDMVAIFYNLD